MPCWSCTESLCCAKFDANALVSLQKRTESGCQPHTSCSSRAGTAKQKQQELWLVQQKHNHKPTRILNKSVHSWSLQSGNSSLGGEDQSQPAVRRVTCACPGGDATLCLPLEELQVPTAFYRNTVLPSYWKSAKGKERARDSWRQNRERFMSTESNTHNRTHLSAKIQREKSGSASVNSKPRQVSAWPDYFAGFSSYIFSPEAIYLFSIFAQFSPKSHAKTPSPLCLSPWAFPLNQDLTWYINKALFVCFCHAFQISKRRANKQSIWSNLSFELFSITFYY